MAQQTPNLKKLEEKFEALFKEETEDSFNKWLADKQQQNRNNMAQQTAVEKLESTIQSMIEHGADLGEDYPALMVHIQQAKEMEKQQQENAWDAAFGEGIGTTMGSVDYDAKFINWYTETYKK
jgi:transcriptional/translational regulatory protein YebC/TACO1